jgi:hypothetical protein
MHAHSFVSVFSWFYTFALKEPLRAARVMQPDRQVAAFWLAELASRFIPCRFSELYWKEFLRREMMLMKKPFKRSEGKHRNEATDC